MAPASIKDEKMAYTFISMLFFSFEAIVFPQVQFNSIFMDRDFGIISEPIDWWWIRLFGQRPMFQGF